MDGRGSRSALVINAYQNLKNMNPSEIFAAAPRRAFSKFRKVKGRKFSHSPRDGETKSERRPKSPPTVADHAPVTMAPPPFPPRSSSRHRPLTASAASALAPYSRAATGCHELTPHAVSEQGPGFFPLILLTMGHFHASVGNPTTHVMPVQADSDGVLHHGAAVQPTRPPPSVASAVSHAHPLKEPMTDFLPAVDLFGNPNVNVLPVLPPTTANLLSAYGNQKMADEWQALFDSVQLAVTAWLPSGRIQNGGAGMTRAHERAMLMGIVALDIAHWLNMLVDNVLSDAEIHEHGRVAAQFLLPSPDAAVCATMGKLDQAKWSMAPSDTDACHTKLTAIFTNASAIWCRMRCADMSVTAYMPHSGITFDRKRMTEGTALMDDSCTEMDNVVVAVCMFPGVAYYTLDGRTSLIWTATVATKVQEDVGPDLSSFRSGNVET
ncbi:hypothetical protein, variant [Allomyces macrogynus ATCC 38327]|uniref:Uncharacterized protein n=1 Tax=Allomyces macrogynus (strain ATCC 38327) TaxID=578462 RepID=A0A0L0T514_ALLM3|nr:hypothetical protein, variant [Allomyces macrogynus ATCC 38327]|eukprot:KNE69898.1 hypothetical protein, variant [Allomyces macrogynus ATCC 38327]